MPRQPPLVRCRHFHPGDGRNGRRLLGSGWLLLVAVLLLVLLVLLARHGVEAVADLLVGVLLHGHMDANESARREQEKERIKIVEQECSCCGIRSV